MREPDPLVFIIDDDDQVRESLANLCRSMGFNASTFTSTEDFMKVDLPATPSCIVLDLRFPGFAPSGLDFQRSIDAQAWPPIIFITGHADIEIVVQAMQFGALEFLTKPVREQKLLDAIRRGIEIDRHRIDNAMRLASLREAYASLTEREREIMNLVAAGHLNKQIAAVIGLSEVTVKANRGRIMVKMGARSLADLVRMSDRLRDAERAASPASREPDRDPTWTLPPIWKKKSSNPQTT
jgi:FixJ family two-component response regulator